MKKSSNRALTLSDKLWKAHRKTKGERNQQMGHSKSPWPDLNPGRHGCIVTWYVSQTARPPGCLMDQHFYECLWRTDKSKVLEQFCVSTPESLRARVSSKTECVAAFCANSNCLHPCLCVCPSVVCVCVCLSLPFFQ